MTTVYRSFILILAAVATLSAVPLLADDAGGGATAQPRVGAVEVVSLAIGLIGGLGLFLYGLRLVSEGMKNTAGDRMRSVLSKLTYNRFIAVGVGAFVTMVIQSSSATTVMLVGFVQARLMSFAQTLGIILGADIGTTVTAQLIAFKITEFALVLVGVGALIMLTAKREKIQLIGETILGFGLLFFGMHVMSESMDPLRSYQPFLDSVVKLENPLLGIIVGTAFTALLQSSSAFVGVLIVLARSELLTLDAAVPLLLGANVGTSVTAVLASVGTHREAKRVAFAHTLFKVVGVLLFVWWIPAFTDLVRWVSPGGPVDAAAYVPRQLANAHTIFNVALTVVLLPLIPAASKLIVRLLPDRPIDEREPFRPRYLDDAMLATPVLALNLAKEEVLRIGSIVSRMVQRVIDAFVHRDRAALAVLDRDEQKVDFLEREVSDYLTRISQQGLPKERIDETFQMMYTAAELELIADIVSKTLVPRARKWLDSDGDFSREGRAELVEYHRNVVEHIDRALEMFREFNLEKAKAIKKKHKEYRLMEMGFMRTHFERLRRDVPESVASSEVHREVIEQL
ncbi:MAG: Na/Pi cotransporter family protein, partial [Candidatus Latescibacterota bacterium]